jgi:signal transduction histidine kinase/ActR/RegA family two-component response regulator
VVAKTSRGIRRRWTDAGILTKGLRVVALPVVALLITSALVLVAGVERDRARVHREAAEAVDEGVGDVRRISDAARDTAAQAAATGDSALFQRVLGYRRGWELALHDLEDAALAQSDATLMAEVQALRAATSDLIAATAKVIETPPGQAPPPAEVAQAEDAALRYETALDSIHARAEQRARDYADAYDADSELISQLIVIAALLGSVLSIAAMVVFAVTTRRRVTLLEMNSRALGEGRELTPLPVLNDELGRLGGGLERATELLHERATALEVATQTVRRSEQRLALALESGAMGTWDVDLVTQQCVWDLHAEAVHGLSPGTFGGTQEHWLEGVHVDDRAAVLSGGDEAVAAGGRWTGQYRITTGSGELRWIGTCGQSVLDEEGTPVRLVGVCSDITEQRLGEQRLLDAIGEAHRANEAKNEFLSRVSHELRTPLNAILGFGQLLEMDDLATAGQRESVGQVMAGGRHLLGLIEDVLDISRIESGNLPVSIEATAVSAVVSESIALVASLAEGLGVVIDLTPVHDSDIHVRADRRRLKQVLVNLASNAIKYNRPGGRVTISCDEAGPGMARLSVRDTGPGIPADRLSQLFTPFDRLGAEHTTVEGSGLGLALSQRLAEMMGATLSVETEVGAGSTFSIHVPLAEDPAVAALTEPLDEPVPATADAPQGTVLYVEDNPSNLKLVQRILERRPGVRLVTAGTGRLAMSLAAQLPLDLVLLDLHLPDVSGAEVLSHLRAQPETAHTPVVVLSADATPGQIDRLHQAGADAFLTKPIDVRKLLETIDSHLTAVLA